MGRGNEETRGKISRIQKHERNAQTPNICRAPQAACSTLDHVATASLRSLLGLNRLQAFPDRDQSPLQWHSPDPCFQAACGSGELWCPSPGYTIQILQWVLHQECPSAERSSGGIGVGGLVATHPSSFLQRAGESLKTKWSCHCRLAPRHEGSQLLPVKTDTSRRKANANSICGGGKCFCSPGTATSFAGPDLPASAPCPTPDDPG